MGVLDGIRLVDELSLDGRRVLIRVDFNVPFDKVTGKITDDDRIRGALPTIEYVLGTGAKVILASHLGRPKGKAVEALSLERCGSRLSELLGCDVLLPDDCLGEAARKVIADVRERQVVLLENLRFHAEEEANDEEFARSLGSLCDVYVGDAFGAAHRAHASVSALPKLKNERGMGYLLRDELTSLARITQRAEQPFVAILGGAKVADKIGVIESLLEKCSVLCIGGAMANTLLAAQGHALGASRVEQDMLPLARSLIEKARSRGTELLLPTDVVVGDGLDALRGEPCSARAVPNDKMALDVGPATVAAFAERIAAAKTLFWNGPMGLFENAAFAAGTLGIARALADASGFTVVGGGDSAAAMRTLDPSLADRVDFISTGGGAALELIEGKRLPGVEALRTTR